MSMGRWVLLGTILSPMAATGQDPVMDVWRLEVRAGVSGTSHASEPDGYRVYSGFAFEVGVTRSFGAPFRAALSIRPESREVEGPTSSGDVVNLGSLEMLPVNLALLWRPLGGGGSRVQPYVGGGLDLTLTWEKSGALDPTDVSPQLGPLIQVGTDVTLARRTVASLDVKWNTLDVEIEGLATPAPRMAIDPLTFGIGIAVAF